MDYIYIFRIIMDCIYIYMYQLKTKTSFKFPNVFFVFFAKKKTSAKLDEVFGITSNCKVEDINS